MRALLLALAAAMALPMARAKAQEPSGTGVPQSRVCTLRVEPGGVTRREGTVINILDPFRVTCNDGANLRATAGSFDQVARVFTLTGDVYFEDPTRSLSSDHAIYDNLGGVLHATGNVVFTDRVEETTLTGPELEYFRTNEQRPEALVNAYGRPRLTMQRAPGVADTSTVEAGAPADTSGMPLTIDADQMSIVGENDLTAVGNVVIEDDDMRALADEAEQRGAAETLELRGRASIHSQEYSLAAETIFATIPDGAIREVEARQEASLMGQDLNVHAPQLNLLFEESLLQRTVARADSALAPGVRPLAVSPTFRLEADSIDASLPGQQLEVVLAIGDARGEMIDTTRVAEPVADSLPAAADTLAVDTTLAGTPPSGVPADTAGGQAAEDLLAATEGGVDRMFAAGDTVVTASAARLVQNDWITGDTITGYFTTVVAPPEDSVPVAGVDGGEEGHPGAPTDPTGEGQATAPGGGAADSAAGSAAPDTTLVMERLVAVGAARSLYHVAPEEGAAPGTLPGINFLSAARIELTFADGQVAVAEVSGLRRGLYLDPRPPGETAEDEEPTEGEDGVEQGVEEPVEVPDPDTDFPEPLDQPPANGGAVD